MTTTLTRILKYPHDPVFDKRPQAAVALRIRHENGCKWDVNDEVLTLTVGDVSTTYDLVNYTVGELAAVLTGLGFQIPYIAPPLAGRNATILIEGHGDQDESNGDHVSAFTSLLWVLYSAYASELKELGEQRDQALRQMIITQAEGFWLQVWGRLYGQSPQPGETDAEFAQRIPEEAFRIRVNGLAIEVAIKNLTGKTVTITEPWRNIFRIGVSKLSGTDRIFDGNTNGYCLIQPISNQVIDWADVLDVIERNRAAGVLVLSPQINLVYILNDPLAGIVWSSDTELNAAIAKGIGFNVLGRMRLSNEQIQRSYMSAQLELWSEGVNADIGGVFLLLSDCADVVLFDASDGSLAYPVSITEPTPAAWVGGWDFRTWALA